MDGSLQRWDPEFSALLAGFMAVPCMGLGRAGGKHRGMPSVVRRRRLRGIECKLNLPDYAVELGGAGGSNASASQQFAWGNLFSPSDTGLTGSLVGGMVQGFARNEAGDFPG